MDKLQHGPAAPSAHLDHGLPDHLHHGGPSNDDANLDLSLHAASHGLPKAESVEQVPVANILDGTVVVDVDRFDLNRFVKRNVRNIQGRHGQTPRTVVHAEVSPANGYSAIAEMHKIAFSTDANLTCQNSGSAMTHLPDRPAIPFGGAAKAGAGELLPARSGSHQESLPNSMGPVASLAARDGDKAAAPYSPWQVKHKEAWRAV